MLMDIDDEEKRKRLERARAISSSMSSDTYSSNFKSISVDNYQGRNEQEKEYISRYNRAREISNSINPRQNVEIKQATTEEIEESNRVGQQLWNLMDKRNTSTNNISATETDEERIRRKMDSVWVDNNENSNSQNTANEEAQWFQFKEFEDGYQFGDISKTALGTATNVLQKFAKGLFSPIENVADIGTNIVATGQDILGFDEAAKKTREFANKDITENVTSSIINASPIGMLYNIVNGEPGKIFNPAEIEYDPNKDILENLGAGYSKLFLEDSEQSYDYSSVSGQYPDQIAELVGYTLGLSQGGQSLTNSTGVKNIGNSKIGASLSGGNIGLTLGGRTINLPTLAIAGGASGGLQEANEKGDNVTEVERWSKAFSGGIVEGITEGIFGFLGIGGNELTDELGKKFASKFSSKIAKMMANLGFHATGEAVEEFLSYAGNFLVDNGIIDKLGDTDFSTTWNWADVGEQMMLAFLSTGLTGGSAMIVDTNAAVKSAEEQLGRELTQEEKQLVTKAVVDETLNEQIQEMYQNEDIPQTFYTSTFNQDGSLSNIEMTRGKAIDNPNSKVNVSPAIVRTGNNIYTVIDSKTGLRLDTTPYTSILAAEAGFNSRMINLKDSEIRAINNKVSMSNIAVNEMLANTLRSIQNDIITKGIPTRNVQNKDTGALSLNVINNAISSERSSNTQNNNDSIIDNEDARVFEERKKSLQKNNGVQIIQKSKVEKDVYEQIADKLIRDRNSEDQIESRDIDLYVENTEEYQKAIKQVENWEENETPYDDNYLSDKFNDIYDKITNALEKQGYKGRRIGENYIYDQYDAIQDSYDEIIDFLRNNNIEYEISNSTEAGDLPSIYVRDEDGNEFRIANHYNHQSTDYDRVYNRAYSNNEYLDWKNVILKDMQDHLLLDWNTILPQKNSSNSNDVKIRDIVKYNPDGREIKDQNYVDFLVERYKDNKNISGIVTDTKYVKQLLKEKKSRNEILKELYSKMQNTNNIKLQVNLKNENSINTRVNLNVDITLTGLKESFNKGENIEKYAIVPYLDKIIETTQNGNGYFIMRDDKNRTDVRGYYYLFNTSKIDNKLYAVKIDIKKTKAGDRFYVHRVKLINNEGASIQANNSLELEVPVGQEAPSINTSIAQKTNSVKPNINNKSMQNKENNTQNSNVRTEKIINITEYDSQGNKLTKAQQEFFKDSKVRDEKGNLLVVYHGTNNFGFTEFRRSANFYTNREDIANTYTGNNGIYRGYLSIKNPIVIDAQKEKWSMIDIDNIKIGGINDVREFLHEQGASIWQEKGKTRTSTADLVQAISDAIDEGQLNADGIIIQNVYDEGTYSNGDAKLGTDYITFKSNQFKNIDNKKPTSNQDIRYEKIKPKTSNSRTLIAQHNTSKEKLLEALDLGALPVPSIAITKYQNPVLKYGDITLLFNKDTINPTDRRNVTYNSDIYSTRKPEIGIALDKQKLKSFEKMATEKGVGYGYLSMIEEYIEQNEFSRARELIQHELEKTNSNVNIQDVEDIYTKLLESIQEKRIMKSGVDPYTPSGNRKSLIQMSVPYTLDNIVKIMTQKSTKGSESNSFAGLAEIRANLAQNFKSIEAMHQNENNLITSEEMENLKQELNDKFYALVDEIAKYDNINRYFGSTEVVANALNETAKAKNLSTAILDNELDYVDIKNVPEKTLQKAIDFLNSLKNIPTEYFEAKPQRAVGFDEIQKAIVPQNTSKELIDKLKSKGIPIEYYSTEDQRQQLISNSEGVRFERTKSTQNSRENVPYNEKAQSDDKNFIKNVQNNNYLQKLMSIDNNQGSTNAQSSEKLIEQQIQYAESIGAFDDTIPVTKLSDIQKTIENYLGKGIYKGHFKERAYGIYKSKNDTIRVKEYKDIDNILHETGHALDLGKRLNIDKESIANELLEAVRRHGGYEDADRSIQLDEGFAEVIKTYVISPSQSKIDYPQTITILEGIRLQDKSFNDFIQKVQSQIYNYIHQNPRNRVLSNVSIGEQTDKTPINRKTIKENVMRLVYDKDYLLKSTVNEFAKLSGKKPSEIAPSRNAYILTRLASGVNNKAISMISDGYIDINGNKLMPGLNKLGEILNNDPQRFNDLRAYLVAKRDLEYKAKTLKTGIRTLDSKAVVEQFQNDVQINEAAQIVYDTLDGVLQYAVNNGLITQDTATALRESNAFYVPFQRVIGNNGNQVGRRGAVSDIIKGRTGSELDIKDVLENIVVNSANIIQQVENNNVLRALYDQGEELGMKNNIFDEIPTPVQKVGTATLSTWKNELRKQGIDVDNIDLEKTIDIFAPNNKVDQKNLITSFIDTNGNRVYLQFAKGTDDIFNSIMGLDKNSNSLFLRLMRKLNMPLRYGATMANIGFAIPNMISDTVQASIYSEAGFIPVLDNFIGILDILSATNKTVKSFVDKISPEYSKRIEYLYSIYSQSGASSSTRLSQYRKSSQEIMKDIYGTKNSKTLGIKESFIPLKRLLDIMTYIPELSEQSTRFRVFERNYEAFKNKGGSETDARIKAAIESRDATQDFGRTGVAMREINQLIPFSAARVGSAYTFSEKITSNTKAVTTRIALLSIVALLIKFMGYDDKEIEELNQRKKNDNFVLKIGDTVITIKKPQGILRSIINLEEYISDLVTGHIEEGKEGEKLVEWFENALMDNLPADEAGGLVPNAIAPIIENSINKDFYYNTDIVKSYDLDLPESEQYYDYTSQVAIWLGKIFNYSPAKIDNLISGYLGGLGTQITNSIDWISGKLGLSAEEPEMGAEDNAVGKRFVVNVNENSASIDEVYTLKDELTKKKNGGTITQEESEQLEKLEEATSNMANINKQIKAIKQDLSMSGTEKEELIRPLQEQKTDVARNALGKDLIYTQNISSLESLKFYPTRDTLSSNGYSLSLTEDMKKEYESLAYSQYQKYQKQGLYSEEYLEQLESKCKDYAKNYLMKKYKTKLTKSK